MKHMFSVDLEDWYCTRAVASVLGRCEWDRCDSRLRIGTDRILDLLQRKGIEATFFVLGYVAERDPELVLEIAERGHEIATHGYAHRSLDEMLPEEFRSDLLRSIDILRSITGGEVRGFRAPNFSMTEATRTWATDIIRECSLQYDSSIFPSSVHPSYHLAGDPASIHPLPNGLIEVPVSCVDMFGLRLPATGGAYFRHAPFWLSSLLLRACERAGRPVLFYLHPWELDPEQPRLNLPLLQRVRQYRGMEKMYDKLDRLTDMFSFTSMRRSMPLIGDTNRKDGMSGPINLRVERPVSEHLQRRGRRLIEAILSIPALLLMCAGTV